MSFSGKYTIYSSNLNTEIPISDFGIGGYPHAYLIIATSHYAKLWSGLWLYCKGDMYTHDLFFEIKSGNNTSLELTSSSCLKFSCEYFTENDKLFVSVIKMK